jgi:hypothetical protein
MTEHLINAVNFYVDRSMSDPHAMINCLVSKFLSVDGTGYLNQFSRYQLTEKERNKWNPDFEAPTLAPCYGH